MKAKVVANLWYSLPRIFDSSDIYLLWAQRRPCKGYFLKNREFLWTVHVMQSRCDNWLCDFFTQELQKCTVHIFGKATQLITLELICKLFVVSFNSQLHRLYVGMTLKTNELWIKKNSYLLNLWKLIKQLWVLLQLLFYFLEARRQDNGI